MSRKREYKFIKRNIRYPRIRVFVNHVEVIASDAETADMAYRANIHKIRAKQRLLKEKYERIKEMAKDIEAIESMSLEEFKEYVNARVKEYGAILGVKPNKVLFRLMRTRWGSKSGKNNITINTLLRYMPHHLIDYVVFHELLHFIYPRHTQRFWRVLESVFGDIEKIHEELAAYQMKLQAKK